MGSTGERIRKLIDEHYEMCEFSEPKERVMAKITESIDYIDAVVEGAEKSCRHPRS